MRALLVASAALLLIAAAAAPAHAQADAAVAREQLKEGSELRKAGKYADAVPHLVESFRLDPQSRTALNLADCEEHVGKLVDAEKHWVAARDRATAESSERARTEAEKRLGQLEPRLPKLTIRVAPGTPADAHVLLDGTELGRVSLGVGLPTDPGAHAVVVRAGGHEDQRFDTTLVEGQAVTLDVTAGAASAAGAAAPAVAPGPQAPATTTPDAITTPSDGSTKRTIGFVVGGVGIVGLGVGTYLAVNAISLHHQSDSACVGGCNSHGADLESQAITSANIANVAFGVGIVGLGVGAFLVLTSGGASSPAPATAFAPIVGPRGGGIGWRGTW